MLCGAIVLLDGYDLQALGLAVPAIARGWSIAPAALSWALSASLIGVGLGAAFLAPLGDRLGRRPVLLGGLLLIGAASLASAFAATPSMLAILRLLTGAGLGVCQANGTALAVEWAPRARRASIMTLMACQVAVGALLGGLFAPIIIAHGGWPGIFLVGGVLPVLLCGVMAVALPESPALLAARAERAASVVADSRRADHSGSLVALIRAPYLPRTMAFWATYTIAAFLIYMLTSWLPVLLSTAGWSRDASVRGITLLQGGGIAGALIVARFIDRRRTIPALCVAYCVAGLTGIAFSLTSSSGAAWPVLLCVLGASVSGGQFGVLTVGALLYPAELRAAGLGTGAAVARIGAVLGPMVGGAVLALGIAPATILTWLALPAGVVALIIGVLRRFLMPDVSNALPPR